MRVEVLPERDASGQRICFSKKWRKSPISGRRGAIFVSVDPRRVQGEEGGEQEGATW